MPGGFWPKTYGLCRKTLSRTVVTAKCRRTTSIQAPSLWCLGYPDQALKRIREALSLAQELSHPFSLAQALNFAAMLHQLRQEGQAAQECAEAAIALSTEQGFPSWVGLGTLLRGWVLGVQGQVEEGVSQIREGLTVWRATGSELWRSHFLALLAEVYRKGGQVEAGLAAVAEALAFVERSEERVYEAELYQIQGELTLQKSKVENSQVESRRRSGRMLSQGYRYCSTPGSQILGTARRHEHGAFVATAGEAGRSAGAASTSLQLVHRGL